MYIGYTNSDILWFSCESWLNYINTGWYYHLESSYKLCQHQDKDFFFWSVHFCLQTCWIFLFPSLMVLKHFCNLTVNINIYNFCQPRLRISQWPIHLVRKIQSLKYGTRYFHRPGFDGITAFITVKVRTQQRRNTWTIWGCWWAWVAGANTTVLAL